jgi:hypothetical protein
MADPKAIGHDWAIWTTYKECQVWVCKNCEYKRDMPHGVTPSPKYLISIEEKPEELLYNCGEFLTWKIHYQ